MSRLVPGCFGREFGPLPDDAPFNIRCGQMRSDDAVHNGGWYNKAGEKLGFGDLSVEDLTHIRDGLQEGEAFIILGERDSFWNFVEHIGPVGSLSTTKPTHDAPGPDYVYSRARYVIFPGRIISPLHPTMYNYYQKKGEEMSFEMTARYVARACDSIPKLHIEFTNRNDLPALMGVAATISEEDD